jgi:hypothetical protein
MICFQLLYILVIINTNRLLLIFHTYGCHEHHTSEMERDNKQQVNLIDCEFLQAYLLEGLFVGIYSTRMRQDAVCRYDSGPDA